jgi:hypothetical protein
MTPTPENVAQTLQSQNENVTQGAIPTNIDGKSVFDYAKVTVIFVLGGPGAGVYKRSNSFSYLFCLHHFSFREGHPVLAACPRLCFCSSLRFVLGYTLHET